MPVGRIILKSISASKKLSNLKTDGARLLYTWLIPHLDINGCFSGDVQVIKGTILTRLNRSIKTIESYIDDLEQNNLIIRYEINGDIFLQVPDFKEKQPSLRPERESTSNIPLPPAELPHNSSRTPAQDKFKLSKDNKNMCVFSYSKDFENLWKIYPRKTEKQKAYKAFMARTKNKVPFSDLKKAVENYAANCKERTIETQYIKHPATFFGSNKPYEDWIEIYQEPYARLIDGTVIKSQKELEELAKSGKIDWNEGAKKWEKVAR